MLITEKDAEGKVLEPLRYDAVPDSWQAPNGPYHQAPVDMGGKWWSVGDNSTPWVLSPPPLPNIVEPPVDFVQAFGREPDAAFPVANTAWHERLQSFSHIGHPQTLDIRDLGKYGVLGASWGMGAPVFYAATIKPTWRVYWPDIGFTYSAVAFIDDSQTAIAASQVWQLERGIELTHGLHPWTPLHLAKPIDFALVQDRPREQAAILTNLEALSCYLKQDIVT